MVYVLGTGISAAGAAATGAAIGGFLTSWSGPGALMGAGIGAGIGALAGGIYSFFTSDEERIKQLVDAVDENVTTCVLTGGNIAIVDSNGKKATQFVVSILDQMKTHANTIAEAINEIMKMN